MKGSKDSDFSLVSNESLCKILPSSRWDLGNMSHNGQKPTSFMMSLTKDPKPKSKKFFSSLLRV